jgi:parallel beta-helix repeat protein
MRASAVIALVALSSALIPLSAKAAVLEVPTVYPTIQAAVDAAAPGDTVKVSPQPNGDPYHENVVIGKESLTLQGVNNPVLDGTGMTLIDPFFGLVGKDAVTIAAAGVTVSGFTIQNYDYPTANSLLPAAGVYVKQQESSTIENNTLRKNAIGFFIDGLANATIIQTHGVRGNHVLENGSSGAWIRSVNGCIVVEDNEFQGNVQSGLEVSGSTGVVVRRNTLSGNGTVPNAFAPALSIASNGKTAGTPGGGKSEFYGNTIVNNGSIGIFVADSKTQKVYSNIVTGNAAGIGLSGSTTCNVRNNEVNNNAGDGIFLQLSTTGCVVQDNVVNSNTAVGISVYEFFFLDTVNNDILGNKAASNGACDGQDLSGLTALLVRNRWSQNVLGTASPSGLK